MTINYTVTAKGMVKSTGKWERIAGVSISEKDLVDTTEVLSEAVSATVMYMRDIVRGGIQSPSKDCYVELDNVVFNPQNFLAVEISVTPKLP